MFFWGEEDRGKKRQEENQNANGKSEYYGMATISRFLKIIGLFCRISSLFYRALLQKRPIILRSLLVVATPYDTHIALLYTLYYDLHITQIIA